MTEAVGVPPEFVAQMRSGPGGVGAGERMTPPEWVRNGNRWPHTLAYDSAIMAKRCRASRSRPEDGLLRLPNACNQRGKKPSVLPQRSAGVVALLAGCRVPHS